MKNLKWLYPGMLIKRWISLGVFGIVMVSMGFVIVISRYSSENKAIAGLIIIIGMMAMIYAVKRIIKSLMMVVAPQDGNALVERIFEKRILEKGPNLVTIGGGTGLSTLLTGLKYRTSNITAIVTVADDGGSSGRLREEFDVLPPGDIRNCLVALSASEDLLGALFQFRFKEGKELHGHNFGNLFITALSQVTGDFAQAIRESSKVLAIRGRVYPATLANVQLAARRANGKEIVGESKIRLDAGSPIERLHLVPNDCKATPEALEAIRQADAIILGPGSLYTSVMPNLLIKEIREELSKSKAVKIYVCNVMTEHGETDDYSVGNHVRAMIEHAGSDVIDYCIGNITAIPENLVAKYKTENQYPVRIDDEDAMWFKQENIELVRAHIASIKEFVRHDPEKLTEAIFNILEASKR
ncbi:MAG TPA: YvcK family protein [Candidatus Omnitrophota bacterium]|nr:YvcK family protein [Candidatus Omnitrophota bacterium]